MEGLDIQCYSPCDAMRGARCLGIRITRKSNLILTCTSFSLVKLFFNSSKTSEVYYAHIVYPYYSSLV